MPHYIGDLQGSGLEVSKNFGLVSSSGFWGLGCKKDPGFKIHLVLKAKAARVFFFWGGGVWGKGH